MKKPAFNVVRWIDKRGCKQTKAAFKSSILCSIYRNPLTLMHWWLKQNYCMYYFPIISKVALLTGYICKLWYFHAVFPAAIYLAGLEGRILYIQIWKGYLFTQWPTLVMLKREEMVSDFWHSLYTLTLTCWLLQREYMLLALQQWCASKSLCYGGETQSTPFYCSAMYENLWQHNGDGWHHPSQSSSSRGPST